MIIENSSYYYTGTNIIEWKNKSVKAVYMLNEKMGTNKDVSVWMCEDDNRISHKVLEVNLSNNPIIYKYAYGGMGDCFPEHLERFPSFKNGKYIFEYTWGNT